LGLRVGVFDSNFHDDGAESFGYSFEGLIEVPEIPNGELCCVFAEKALFHDHLLAVH
jgi:hypothetical protein